MPSASLEERDSSLTHTREPHMERTVLIFGLIIRSPVA
jgi:hypothetical protein